MKKFIDFIISLFLKDNTNKEVNKEPVIPTGDREISGIGLNLVKHFEGLYLKAYLCPANVWTIGYGHTKNVKPGDVINEKKAEELLRQDMDRFETGVTRLVKVPLKQRQFDALVSFSFNVGLGALRRSTLLSKLNKGNYKAAADEFKRWNKGGGKVLRGLVRRRKAERDLFLTGTFTPN